MKFYFLTPRLVKDVIRNGDRSDKIALLAITLIAIPLAWYLVSERGWDILKVLSTLFK